MSKKAVLPTRIAPLQRVIAEAITDPAEQAALDKSRKRKKGVHGRHMNRDSEKARANSAARKRG